MERRSLKYFQDRTALELSGYFDAPFWNKLILQAAQSDHAIRHSLVAIASLHESLSLSYEAEAVNPGGPGNKERSFSIQQYNQAINQLTLYRDGRPITLEVVLLACVLFICYENFESEYQNALTHIQNGLTILESLRKESSSSFSKSHHDADIMKSLANIFERLQHQYSRFISAQSTALTPPAMQTRSPEDILHEPALPNQFFDLYAARHYLDVVISWEMMLTPPLFVPGNPEYHKLILQLIHSTLEKWHSRFDRLLDQSRHRQDFDFQTAAITTKLHATVATILPVTLPSGTESIYDDYTAKFAFMIAEAKRMNAMGYRDRNAKGRKVTFGFDLGITPVVYLVASRCRDPYLRRSAIEQLKAFKRREGVWDSTTAARIAERIMAIEEQGISRVKTCKDVPEHRRIRLLSTDAHPHNGRMRLYFVRAPYDMELGPIEEDSVIWDSSKPIFQGDSSQVQFWNSIYCNTYSNPTTKTGDVPAVGFAAKDKSSHSPFSDVASPR